MRRLDPIFDTVESFFTDHLKLTLGCTQCTLSSYRDTLRLLFEYASKKRRVSIDRLRMCDFDADLVLEFLEYLESERHNKISTRNCRLAAVRSFFAYALERNPEYAGHLARIVALKPKRHSQTPARYLDPSAIQVLLRTPDHATQQGRRDFALILFMFNTGARSAK
jgi:site-specific recombinase XerD